MSITIPQSIQPLFSMLKTDPKSHFNRIQLASDSDYEYALVLALAYAGEVNQTLQKNFPLALHYITKANHHASNRLIPGSQSQQDAREAIYSVCTQLLSDKILAGSFAQAIAADFILRPESQERLRLPSKQEPVPQNLELYDSVRTIEDLGNGMPG